MLSLFLGRRTVLWEECFGGRRTDFFTGGAGFSGAGAVDGSSEGTGPDVSHAEAADSDSAAAPMKRPARVRGGRRERNVIR